MTKRITGIILAGGQSRRMAMDKAWLPWEGGPLIKRVLDLLRPIVDELIISVKDDEPFRVLDARIVKDVVPDGHALGGLYSGLQAARNSHCFVCACDMPFLNPSLIRWLAAQAEDYGAVVPKTADGLQPLHAIYSKTVFPVVAAQLHQRRFDLRAFLPLLRVKVIGPELLKIQDPEGRSVFNMNTPAEYLQARKLYGIDAHHRRPDFSEVVSASDR